MRRPICKTLSTAALVAALAGLCGVGCSSTPTATRQQTPPAKQAQAGPGGTSLAADGALPPEPEEMQRLLARLDSLEMDNQDLKRQLSEQYHEAIALRRAQMEAERRRGGEATADGGAPADTQANASQSGKPPTAQTPMRGLDDYSRVELLDALVTQIVDGDDAARVKALTVAAISVASQRHDLDHRLLDQLDPRTREQVARFHQMLAVIYDEMAGDASRELTRREMIDKIDEVFGQQPLNIEALELCRRVDSYGVYEPFPSTRFLAGRKNRVLIYVELENFYHHETEDGQYEVKLEQSVELYDATGETTVWRQGPVELVDVSRNRRRDFFIVYPVDLPERLTAGGYLLKVRVADKHTGSICEQTLRNIEIVADQTMVGGR